MNYEYFVKSDEATWAQRGDQATSAAMDAFDRLVRFAESSERGQGQTVARFLAALLDVYPLDVYDLRAVDIAISDDMLTCLEAVRWNRVSVLDLVPNGHERCIALCKARGYFRRD